MRSARPLFSDLMRNLDFMRKPVSTKLLMALALAVSIAPLRPAFAQTVNDPALGGAAVAPLTNNPATGNISPPPVDTPAPAPKPKAKSKKKKTAAHEGQKSLTFDGKLGAVDKTAMTITVAGAHQQVLKITSNTRINKDGNPALLADGKINEEVSGQFIKSADGSEEATLVNFGAQKSVSRNPQHKAKAQKTKPETPTDLTPVADTNKPPAATEAPLTPDSK